MGTDIQLSSFALDNAEPGAGTIAGAIDLIRSHDLARSILWLRFRAVIAHKARDQYYQRH